MYATSGIKREHRIGRGAGNKGVVMTGDVVKRGIGAHLGDIVTRGLAARTEDGQESVWI
jgi:hypothetical protein